MKVRKPTWLEVSHHDTNDIVDVGALQDVVHRQLHLTAGARNEATGWRCLAAYEHHRIISTSRSIIATSHDDAKQTSICVMMTPDYHA